MKQDTWPISIVYVYPTLPVGSEWVLGGPHVAHGTSTPPTLHPALHRSQPEATVSRSHYFKIESDER